jgi:hypothetical protein
VARTELSGVTEGLALGSGHVGSGTRDVGGSREVVVGPDHSTYYVGSALVADEAVGGTRGAGVHVEVVSGMAGPSVGRLSDALQSRELAVGADVVGAQVLVARARGDVCNTGCTHNGVSSVAAPGDLGNRIAAALVSAAEDARVRSVLVVAIFAVLRHTCGLASCGISRVTSLTGVAIFPGPSLADAESVTAGAIAVLCVCLGTRTAGVVHSGSVLPEAKFAFRTMDA